MKKKTLGIIIVSVLGAAAILCSAMFTHQYLDAKNSKAAFDDLTNLIMDVIRRNGKEGYKWRVSQSCYR